MWTILNEFLWAEVVRNYAIWCNFVSICQRTFFWIVCGMWKWNNPGILVFTPMLQDFCVEMRHQSLFPGSSFIRAVTDSADSYPKAECPTWHNCTLFIQFLSPLYGHTLTFYSLVMYTLTCCSLVGSELRMCTQRLVSLHCKSSCPDTLGGATPPSLVRGPSASTIGVVESLWTDLGKH